MTSFSSFHCSESICLAPIDSSRPPPAQLPAVIGRAHGALSRLAASTAQLDALLLALPSFAGVRLPLLTSTAAPDPAAGEGSQQQAKEKRVELVFLDAEMGSRITVSVPFSPAILSEAAAVQEGHGAAKVSAEGPRIAAAAAAAAEDLAKEVSSIPAGPAWLQRVAFAAQEAILGLRRRAAATAADGPTCGTLRGEDRQCLGERPAVGRTLIRAFD